jgi:Glycosyl hydrolase family 1
VEAPPFTTTRVPQLPIAVPSPPPALYPSWFAPEPKDILPHYKLPKGFKFGVATAAYQVEGAVKNEGKGPNMWDWNSRQPGGVIDNTTGPYNFSVSKPGSVLTAHSRCRGFALLFVQGRYCKGCCSWPQCSLVLVSAAAGLFTVFVVFKSSSEFPGPGYTHSELPIHLSTKLDWIIIPTVSPLFFFDA